MASYGQLVGQPAYDDSGLFNRPGAAPESEAASSCRSSPALKITVTDPLKKVSCYRGLTKLFPPAVMTLLSAAIMCSCYS